MDPATPVTVGTTAAPKAEEVAPESKVVADGETSPALEVEDSPVKLHKYFFDVKMTCGGCSGAVTRVLSKLEGVEAFDVSLEKQEVHVTASIPYEDVLEKIKKTGKEVRSGRTLE